MTIRNSWAKIIPALWWLSAVLPAAAPPATSLAGMVRALRGAPTPARRAAVQSYAIAHPKEAPLAELALAIASYEQQDYPAAIATLKKIQPKLQQLADYTAYYLAASEVEARQSDGIVEQLAPVQNTEVRSPLAGKAWIVAARAEQSTQPAEAVRLLREHYTDLRQPDGDIALADAYQAAGDLPHAADFYQRVYYQYLSGDAATRAAAAILALKDSMGASYPQPLAAQMLQRAARLNETRQYSLARSEYQALSEQLTGLERDQARVRIGGTDFISGNVAAGCAYLKNLEVPESEAAAERLYYLEECARRAGDDAAMMAAVKGFEGPYPKSPWRLRALAGAANRYLVLNRPDDFVPLYKAAYENFPNDGNAGVYQWKVAFQAYLRNQSDAPALIREQLSSHAGGPNNGAALYFLGRYAEQHSDFAAARTLYQRLAEVFQNTYYAMLARDRLVQAPVAAAGASPDTDRFLSELKLPEPKPFPREPVRATTARIERSRLLRTAGLTDLADAELRFGARTDGQPALLGMELATEADAPHQSVRIMKGMTPDYLLLAVPDAPRRFWELLFPLPYRTELVRDARLSELDPFLVAGLTRQESEFNPDVVSSAKAYGLMQVRPSTGRAFARRAGIARFTTGTLLQPNSNLRIGTMVFRSMLDQNGGNLEHTIASYNAGPSRVVDWRTWSNFREPAEFIESIPFTETRDYVQAVLRNADVYRRLYK